jgi:hypothetical protein
MTTTILRSMDEVKEALNKGQRVTAYFFMGHGFGPGNECTVKQVLAGYALCQFGVLEDLQPLLFNHAKQWVASDTLTFGGRTTALVPASMRIDESEKVMPITSQAMLDMALASGTPVQCGIDWAKPGSERTVAEQVSIPFIGGPRDGKQYVMRMATQYVEVLVVDETGNYVWSGEADTYAPFKKVVHSLRNIAGISVYAPHDMTDRDVMIRLIENYKPTDESK